MRRLCKESSVDLLDESISLVSDFHAGTLDKNDIEIWFFFNEIIKHSKKFVLMDGAVSQRSLRLAS